MDIVLSDIPRAVLNKAFGSFIAEEALRWKAKDEDDCLARTKPRCR